MSDQTLNAPLDLPSVVSPVSEVPRELFIYGITHQGQKFRPSDWAERLCGVMAGYRPGGRGMGRNAFIGYSPYVRPLTLGDVRCVVVDERLQDIEPKALSFVLNFARDNDLPVLEACSLPETRSVGKPEK